MDNLKADPGYGLPKLKVTQTARIEGNKSINRQTKHQDQQIQILSPNGKVKVMPIATIAYNNMNKTYGGLPTP